ncbi:MAG: putative DNA binding domain-containing protein [Rhodoferax sp.]|nr:putative DNA binding domain-containing protein [Rhodoferax sp.]
MHSVINLDALIAAGEDSRHQFKRDIAHVDKLAAELVAFANSAGGQLLIGVADNGHIAGLTSSDISRLNQLVSNAASQHVKPPINPLTTNVDTGQGLVMVVEIAQGLNKPYMDSQGRIWVKSGADKRQVTAREEMQRMFQAAGLVHADELPVGHCQLDDLDQVEFSRYFERRYGKPVSSVGIPFEQLLQNLNLARPGAPNLTGMLLFGKAPSNQLPAFVVKAVAFPGTVLHDTQYLDSEDIDGTLPQQYQRCIAFIKRNLHHVQGKQSFNSPGQLEIPAEVFEEVLVNALVHRDYFISAPIRLMIFADRVELISPGHLPNHLDTEKIRYGLSNLRNPALASHAFHMLPYRGLGSGIPRAVAAWPKLEFIDDRQGNQFKVIVKRGVQQPEGANEGANEGVNNLLVLITDQPGLRGPALAKWLGTSPKNVERWLKQLKDQNLIEFRGATKTGGYYSKTSSAT